MEFILSMATAIKELGINDQTTLVSDSQTASSGILEELITQPSTQLNFDGLLSF